MLRQIVEPQYLGMGSASYYELKGEVSTTTISSPYQFTGLACNTDYTFQVRAYNGVKLPQIILML
jgi:hypothetical protein